MRSRIVNSWVIILALSLAPGCALLEKGEPGAARYFSLEQAVVDRPAPDVAVARDGRAALRLGRVTGAAHLEERLVFRDSDHEVGYYCELRWTEPPERFLERLLARVLFEERGLKHVVGGASPTLDVELTAFEEIRGDEPRGQSAVRVQVVARLHDERLVLWEETLMVARPVAAPVGAADPELALATVAALAAAARIAVERIVDEVLRAIEAGR